MLIKSIKVRNFRQFKGEQSLDFATDGASNVTVVMGVNASGKTSFAQAFRWCLYGDTDFKDRNIFCKAVEQEMGQDSKETAYVQLVLEHKGTQYTIRRTQRVHKVYGGKMNSELLDFSIAYSILT